ncbi:recombinase family protein [Bacillus cereus]|nr:recombinase family protein [Bacillus cereus]
MENAHPAIIDEESWEKISKLVNTYSFLLPGVKTEFIQLLS